MSRSTSSITTIFFDAGGTLVYSRDLWQPIYQEADRAMLAFLRSAGIDLAPDDLSRGHPCFLDAYYDDRGDGIVEKTTLVSLRETLEQKGFRDVPLPVLRKALDRLFAVTQQNWYLEADAIPTLEWLKSRGYRLGMITNGSDDNNLYQILDRNALRPYFDAIISSAACFIRKPDERIYRLALKSLDASPSQSAMVGDTPEADILGSSRLGLYSIWITRRAAGLPLASARPSATVSTLAEIPALFS